MEQEGSKVQELRAGSKKRTGEQEWRTGRTGSMEKGTRCEQGARSGVGRKSGEQGGREAWRKRGIKVLEVRAGSKKRDGEQEWGAGITGSMEQEWE